MRSVKSVLIERDGLHPEEADRLIGEFKEEAVEAIEDGDYMRLEDMCLDHFGLEPDYLDDLIFDMF